MATYVAMLKGINLGAHKRVSMKDLRTLFEELGGDVRVHGQTGNVVLSLPAKTPAAVAAAAEKAIADRLELDVAVIVRTAAEMNELVDANPFIAAKKDPKALHLTFLDGRPAAGRTIDAAVGGKDEFVIRGKDVFLHCPDGYGRTKLNNAFFERQLGVRATTRNWNVVSALADLASG